MQNIQFNYASNLFFISKDCVRNHIKKKTGALFSEFKASLVIIVLSMARKSFTVI